MKPFRWWFSRIYWAKIVVNRPSYLSRVLCIAAAVITLSLFVAVFYDPAEAHRSHAPQGYAVVTLLSMMDLMGAVPLLATVCLFLLPLLAASSGLTSSVLRI